MEPLYVYQRPVTPISLESSSGMSDVDQFEGSSAKGALRTALHVIRTERDALTALEDLYEADDVAQKGFADAVTAIAASINCGGKLVISGVGKSGKIGKKVVATMNSFGIRSNFLYPTEALHGDLGLLHENDTLLVITFSGRTPELFSFLPHVPANLPLIALTSHALPSTCPLFQLRPANTSILLPAPIPTSEETSFGVAAPTTSTTVALTLSDALALAVARRLHPNPSAVFKSFHPGGAIGLANQVVDLPSPGSGVVTAVVLPE